MLLALIFRGVAFEFRFKQPELRRWWDRAFCFGSTLAAFSQGVVLGTFIQGFQVSGRVYTGSSFDWVTPFAMTTGVALVFGYSLLGAGWLVIKTEARPAGLGTPRRPLCACRYRAGHRDRQHLDAVPAPADRQPLVFLAQYRWLRLRADPDRRPERRRVVRVFAQGRVPALLRRDGAVPAVLPRHRHQPVADDRPVPLYACGTPRPRPAHRPSC